MRCVVAAIVLTSGCLLIAAAPRADERASIYEFVTLYSPAHRLLPDRRLGLAARAPRAYEPTPLATARGAPPAQRRLRWQDRVPWWREETIERGSQPPYEQERNFEQSLEANRAYYEGSRHARTQTRESGRDQPYSTLALARQVRSGPEIAAAIWRPRDADNVSGKRDTRRHPALPQGTVSVLYKGVTIIGSAYPDASNDAFFEIVKKAIDMADALPKDLLALFRRVDWIAYDPPSKHRRARGAIVDMAGVYAIADLNREAPIIIYKDMRNASPLQVALSILGGGMMAARHDRLIALLQRQKN